MKAGTVKFEVSIHSKASPEDIIEVIDKWEDLPKYWHGIRTINMAPAGMFLVRFAFPGEGKMSYICDRGTSCCTENYHSGPFTGFKRIEISKDGSGSKITAKWDIHLSLRLLILKGFITRHFRQGTENALKRISQQAEQSIVITVHT